jgi:hypothetical protein
VLTGGGFGTDEEEEELAGLAVEGIELDPLPRGAADHLEASERRALPMRHRDAKPDPGAQHRFPLLDRLQDLVHRHPGALGQQRRKLLQHTRFVGGVEGDPDAVGMKQVGELHAGNVTGRRKRGN